MQILLSAFGAFVVYMAIGGLLFTRPWMKNEFLKYSTIYRSQNGIKKVMPFGMLAMFVAMFMLTVLYSMIHHTGTALAEGVTFGALVGIFCVCSFVVHNYVNLNIGVKLTVYQSLAYFFEWLAVGIT